MILVDSNVLISLFNREPEWLAWTRRELAAHRREGLAINQLVYAETSAKFASAELLDAALGDRFIRLDLPWEAAFVAGAAQREYRRRGGARSSTLPDFYIGAHAQVAGLRLLTRDATRYRSYFDYIDIIAPGSG